jgi:hypothetical protein
LISCSVADSNKICMGQISCLHFIFQDFAATFAEILEI